MPARPALRQAPPVSTASRRRRQGFPPLVDCGCRALVVGSLPGEESLRRRQYYAHPRNAFWPIVGEVTGCAMDAPYALRSARLVAAGLAVWDVLAAGVRPGSLDQDIDETTARINDFSRFFRRYPAIRTVLCNGTTARRLFVRGVLPQLTGQGPLRVEQLPSTSPAHAALAYASKRALWLAALRTALADRDG
jgi:double-stranded uracil-DNA glycosylase